MRACTLVGLLAGLSTSASLPPELPTSDELIEKYVTALGGRAAVDRIRTREMRGCYLPTSETPCVPFDVFGKAPDKWKTVMTSPGILRLERMGAAGEGWEQMSDQKEAMKADAAFEAALGFNFDMALHPRDHFSEFTVRSKDAQTLVVDAKTAAGHATSLDFDAGSNLLTRIGGYRLKDYRAIDGVMTPTSIEQVKSGTRFRFEHVRNNVDIADGVFRPDTNLAPHTAGKDAMRRAALEEATRGMDITAAERAALAELEFFSPHEGRMLFDFIRLRGYRRGLEIGTAWGNSAIWMAMAFKRNGGTLVTIELRPEFAERARKNFARAGLADTIESRVNDALKEIPDLSGKFDFVFMDTGTKLHAKFLEMLNGKVEVGGAIVSHNADTFERDQPEFRRAVMENPDLETSLLLTPGGGMSVSIRRH